MDLFICKRCNTKFSNKFNLKSHLLKNIPCDFFEIDFDRNLLIDELYQRKLNDKTFDCEYCNKKFNHTSTKTQHKKICKQKPLDKITILEQTVEKLVSKIDDQQSKINEQQTKIEKLEAQPKNIDKIKLDLQYYKNRKNENFYQLLIENFFRWST